jgi:hypothetical protein
VLEVRAILQLQHHHKATMVERRLFQVAQAAEVAHRKLDVMAQQILAVLVEMAHLLLFLVHL